LYWEGFTSWVETVVVRVCERKYSQPQVQHHPLIMPMKPLKRKFCLFYFTLGRISIMPSLLVAICQRLWWFRCAQKH